MSGQNSDRRVGQAPRRPTIQLLPRFDEQQLSRNRNPIRDDFPHIDVVGRRGRIQLHRQSDLPIMCNGQPIESSFVARLSPPYNNSTYDRVAQAPRRPSNHWEVAR